MALLPELRRPIDRPVRGRRLGDRVPEGPPPARQRPRRGVRRGRLGPHPLRLPTDDEIAGGQFVQWFRLARVAERRSAAVPDVVGRTTAAARREIEALGLVVGTVVRTQWGARGRVLRVDPAPGTALLEGDTVSVIVSKGRAG